MINRHMKRCSKFEITRKMQIQNYNAVSLTTCCHQNDQRYHAGEYVEKKEHLDVVGGNVEWYSQYA